FALQQVRDAACEFNDVEPALNVAARVRNNLAVLARKQMGKLVHIAFDEGLEFEEDAGAPLRIDRGPCRLRSLCIGHRAREEIGPAERNHGLYLANRRVMDGRLTVASGLRFPVNEMMNRSHNSSFV